MGINFQCQVLALSVVTGENLLMFVL